MVGAFYSVISEEILGFLADLSSLAMLRFTCSNATTTTVTTTTTTTTVSSKMENISVNEINMVMNRLGMCSKFESKGKEFVSRDEFESLFEDEEPCLEEIWEVFKVFDENRDGFIDAMELGRVLCRLGLVKEGSNVERCKMMIKGFDRNGDGLLDFSDFLKFMEKCLC